MDAVCCSSWTSTVKARQAVGNDLAIQLVKRVITAMSAVSAFWGDVAGKGNNTMDMYKMRLQQLHLTYGFCRDTGNMITFLASSLDFPKELRMFISGFFMAIECIKTSTGM